MSSNQEKNTDKSTVELYFLMKKLKEYEPGIYDNIKKTIGVPKMSVGSLFRFSEQHTDCYFKVIRVSKLSPIEAIYRTPEQIKNKIAIYKYGYCMNNYTGFQMLNFIYDSYIEAGYIHILEDEVDS